MEEYRQILVPVDGSDLSKIAFRKALSLAKEFGSNVELLHVNEGFPSAWGMQGMDGVDIYEKEIRDQMEQNTEAMMEEYRKISKEKGIETKSDIVNGNAADVIIDASRDYDLIVMGTHGKGGLLHLLIGGTAEKVVRHACCPIFLIRERTKHCGK
jgi:nucleotide-binding universal stress UspA family protein